MGNFHTDFILQSDHADDTDRINDVTLLEPVTRQKVLAIVAGMRVAGIACTVYETYRSQARQYELYQQGATQLAHVGCHGYGVAADIVMLDDNGNPTWDEGYYAHYNHLAHFAALQGMIWGGDWGHPWRPTSFPDLPHVQRVRVDQQSALFDGSWYPSDDGVVVAPPVQLMPLFLNGNKVADMIVRNGISLCPVLSWGKALGLQVGWDGGEVTFDRQPVGRGGTIIDGHAFIPIRTLATAAGLNLALVDGKVIVSKP